MNQSDPADARADGATVVITHRVQPGKEGGYEAWLDEVGPLCRASPGHLDWHVIRPIAGLTTTYTIVIRFDTGDHVRHWMGSEGRHRQIEKVRPLLALEDAFTIRSGLDFWFMPPGAGVKVPVRWKQFLITWSAIYPLALGVPLALAPVLGYSGMAGNRFFSTLLVTGAVVFLMVYVVMPRYTKLVRGWLFE